MNDEQRITMNPSWLTEVQEKAKKDYQKTRMVVDKHGKQIVIPGREFIHPLDWRHKSHDIYADIEFIEGDFNTGMARENLESINQTLDSFRGELKFITNKLNKHIDNDKRRDIL